MAGSMPLHIVLYQPQIPANTGNVIRLCANCGAHLHLIEPMRFELDDKRLKRAGLDYHEFAQVRVWANLTQYQRQFPNRRLVYVETTGAQVHSAFSFQLDDALVFGSETEGLPNSLLAQHHSDSVYLPMQPNSRSLNLSNCVAVVVYEARRQLGYPE
jgi:tRNA (cytidine/uridine-2'-O-)-methyltransferase